MGSSVSRLGGSSAPSISGIISKALGKDGGFGAGDDDSSDDEYSLDFSPMAVASSREGTMRLSGVGNRLSNSGMRLSQTSGISKVAPMARRTVESGTGFPSTASAAAAAPKGANLDFSDDF